VTNDRKRLELGVQASIWLMLILSYALVFARFMPITGSFLRALGNMLPILLLFYGNMRLVERFFIPKRYLTYLLWCLPFSVLITLVRTQFNVYFIDYKIDFLPETNLQFLLWASVISNIAVLLVSTIYQLLIHRSSEEKKALLAANQHQQAQLLFLRSQINPHFLFNTLNNIYSLAVTRSQKTAPMVLQLSELLRYVVYDGQAEKVALNREAEQIEKFIALFQMRQETPVDIIYNKDEFPPELKIEPMILIPIVENCFKHCDFDTNPNAFVQIQLGVEAGALSFSTYNSRDNADLQKDTTGGVGLINIKKRLALKYPTQHNLTIEKAPDAYRVHLKIKS